MLLRDIAAVVALNEEELETQKAEDVWSENKDRAADYRSLSTYDVRPVKDTKPTSYEVFAVNGTTRKPYGKFTADKLNDILVPIQPNQTPDAEGYVTYVDKEKTEAIQWDSDPIKVVLGASGGQRLSKGDYLLRAVSGDSFEYNVEQQSSFEATMKKA